MTSHDRPVIVGIAGSLRQGSYNAALLRAAVELAPGRVRIEPASIRDVPLYNGDVEAESGIPPAVSALKDRVASAAGLLLVTPEYNNSIPGVLKNAIDWMTRPPSDISRVFGDRPVALMGATVGPMRTVLAQTAWLLILRTLKTRPYFGGRLGVGSAGDKFDDDGRLTDERTRERLAKFLDGFATFALEV